MLNLPRRQSLAAAILAVTAWLAGGSAQAGGWLAPGDAGLRDDLSRLVDESVIDLPLMAWPIHEDAVRAALDAVPEGRALTAGQQGALSRLRLALDRQEWSYSLALSHRPNPVRTFDDEPRDEAELGLVADWEGERWAARLDVTAVADPADGQAVRPDGSYVAGRLGNWAVTAGWLERWWGPGWNGSLLLGTAARPVPALSLDRAVMTPFETRWLSWLGPWTVNAFAGAMEGHRQDRDHPVLMGLRVAARPLNGLEIALERTAQWCAEGLPCGLSAFGDVLLGNDNQGENVAPGDEPGNQLAGWSARWSSPIGNWPFAIYAQSIGEAMGKSTIPWPVQRLSVQGIEVWGTSAGGSPWRLYAEYADTTCHVKVEEFFDCAYNNGLFPVEGYRFRGRPVGHALDGDGRMYSLGFQVRGLAGADWQLLARSMDINRGGQVPDLQNTLSPAPLELLEAQVRADFDWLGGRMAVGLAAERREPLGGARDTEARAFVRYVRSFGGPSKTRAAAPDSPPSSDSSTVSSRPARPARTAATDPWAGPGDVRLRHDLQLLADSGIVKAPLTSWPVSWAEVARDLASAPEDASLPPHIGAALARVRSNALYVMRIGEGDLHARLAGSADPMALRRFGRVPREAGEIEAGMQYTGEWFAFRAQATAVADADDGQDIRPDGSYVGAVLGNWVLSAGWIDRWWGPGWEGSLIYGSNSRPIPAVTIERNYSDSFDHPWLAWIGQWRLAATMGQLEGDRVDAPDAKFFGMRATWKPHQRLEVGLSRSAQWCGEGRPCGAGTFWDLLIGNDNDQPLAQQPGNQMAGLDVRWSLPWLPLAVYAQAIGEDEANYMPSKYLGLVGAETWGGWGDRSWRVHLEYADTACAFYESAPQYGCAYRQSIYSDGYQYRDRSIGHSVDGDSQQLALGAVLVNADGSSWEFAAQDAKINRASANPVHSVAPFAAKIRSADVYHRRMLLGGDLSLGLGYEQRDLVALGQESDDLRGFAEWTRRF